MPSNIELRTVSPRSPSEHASSSVSPVETNSDLESGQFPSLSAAVSNIANTLENSGSGQHPHQSNLISKKKLMYLVGGLFVGSGLTAGLVPVLKSRLRSPQAVQPPFVCRKEGDAMRTRVYGAQIHFVKSGNSTSVPSDKMIEKINGAFGMNEGINAIFESSCDAVLDEKIRFTRLGTDTVDATDFSGIDYTKPWVPSDTYRFETLASQADPKKQSMHLYMLNEINAMGSACDFKVGGAGEPDDNHQVYSIDYLSWPIPSASSGADGFLPSVIAHEFGHNFGLYHQYDKKNIMTHRSGGVEFTKEQCEQISKTLQTSLSSLVDLCEEQSRVTSNPTTLQPSVAPITKIEGLNDPHDRQY